MLDMILAAVAAALICTAVPEVAPGVAEGWQETCFEVAFRAQTEQDLDPSVAVSVAWHESWLDADAVGAAGELGPLQALPSIWCEESPCDTIGAGLRALRVYVDHHGYHDAMCRYKGAPVGCPSSERRMEFAYQLRRKSGVGND